MFLACVHTVTRYYLPDERNPRFDTQNAAQVLDEYLRVQCPERLAAKKLATRNVRIGFSCADSTTAGTLEVLRS